MQPEDASRGHSYKKELDHSIVKLSTKHLLYRQPKAERISNPHAMMKKKTENHERPILKTLELDRSRREIPSKHGLDFPAGRESIPQRY